jgi:hypothetical protein
MVLCHLVLQWRIYPYGSSSPSLPEVSQSMVSVTYGQLRSKNAKWKILEIGNSSDLNWTLFWIVWWNLTPSHFFPLGTDCPSLAYLHYIRCFKRKTHIQLTFITVYCYNCSIFYAIVNPLLWLIYNLNFIIGMYIRKNSIYRIQY